MSNAVDTRIRFGSGSFKKYLKNTGWLMTERIIRMVVTFFTGIYIVRYLGPADFGIFSYVLSFVGLFSTLAILGLDSIVTRELVKTPEDRDELLGTVFFLRLFGAVLTVLLVWVSSIILQETAATTLMLIILASATLLQSFGVIEYYFQSSVRSKFPVMVQFTTMITGSAAKLFLIYYNASLLWFIIITAAESLILGGGMLLIYTNDAQRISAWRYSMARARHLLQDAWPLLLSGLMVAIYMRIGQVFIKNFLSAEQLGYYSAAVRLSEAWYFIPMAVTTSLFPALVSAKESAGELFLSRLQKLYALMAAIAIGIAFPVTFLSGFIVQILFGESYAPAAGVLTIYIWAALPAFLGVASSQFLVAENLTRISFWRTAAGMAANVGLNLLLIPPYGIIGSAIATLISYTIATFLLFIWGSTRQQAKMMLRAVFLMDLPGFLASRVYPYLTQVLGKKKDSADDNR